MTGVPVTVVGLGSMGTALASALLQAGHPVTVWNRTAAKAAPLVAKGAGPTRSIRDAVTASPLTIACLTTYDDTRQALEPAAAALAGRALVTLNSGSPSGARQMSTWTIGHGARFLDGAIKNVPAAVGAPDTLLYYSGDRSVFDEFGTTLKALGGETVHLGDEPDLAALYEMAVGGTLLPLLIAREIDSGDYTQLGASVDVFAAGIAHDQELRHEAKIDTAWHTPLHALLRRAIAAGYGEHSISALVELLKKPEQAERQRCTT